ncbi:MAG: hypothetical protein DCF13_13430 [Flavobacteriaceae bacterium]|nr:MAG: hypothetical protein DCF13_13430 [Flavobacteriaceae bacterium]
MKKKYKFTLRLKFFILILVSLLSQNITAQCTTGNLFPANTYTPTYDGLNTINSNASAGEYCLMNFEANKSFTFSSSVVTDYITITNNSGNVIYASGTTPLNYNSGANPGILRYYIHKSAACDVEATFRTRYVRGQNLVNCTTPENFSIIDIKSTTVRIVWSSTYQAPEFAYSIYVTTNNVTPSETTAANYSSFFTDKLLSDLTPNTTYNYWVKTNCTSTVQSAWTYGGSFKTSDDCKRDVLGQYPTNLITNTCVPFVSQNNPPNVVATDSYAGEYYLLSVFPGSSYIFESSNLSDYITVTDEFGEFVLNSGKSPLGYNNKSNTVRVYTNSDSQCGSEQVERTTSVRCRNENPVIGDVVVAIENLEVNEITSTTAKVNFSYIDPQGFAPILTYFYTSNYEDLGSNPISGAVTINLDTLPSSSVNLTNLLPDTVYYFNIGRGTSLGNYSGYKIVFKTKSAGVCYSPSGLAVENINFSSASLIWNYSSPIPANGYQYYINTTNTPPNFSTTPTGSTTNANVFLSGLNSNTLYYYWVRTNCGSGLGDWTGSNFKTLGTALCTSPTPLPTTSITGSSATLNWTAPLSAPSLGYQYYISTTNNSPLAITNATGSSTTTNVVIIGLSETTTYYFWIRSNCGSSQSSWVSGGNFTTTVLCSAPTQVSGEGISESQAIISWTAANPSPNNGYQYYLSTNNTPPGVTTNPTGSVANTSTTLNGLLADTEYYLWVRSNCGTNFSAWVSSGGFITDLGPACGAPSNLSVSNVTNDSAQFSWNAPTLVPGNGYQYYYNTTNVTPSTTTTANGTSFTTNKVVTGLSPQTTYYIWIRSNCGSSQSIWVSGGSFTTSGTTVCNSPMLPETSNITTNSVTISWTAPNPIPTNGYQYYYNTTGVVPDENTVANGNIAGTSVTLSGLLSGTMYFSWIRSNCGNEQSDWSVVGSFTTLSSSCDTPNNVTVVNVYSTSSLIQWNAPNTTPSNGYQYYYSTSADTPTFSTTPTGSTSIAIFDLTGLISGTTYYFWVRSNCGSQQSNWSLVTSLTTKCSMVTNPNDTNPTLSSIQLSWGLQYPDAAPANGYDYYYSTTNSTPSETTTPSGSSTITSVTITSGLLANTTYYYWIRSNCGNGVTLWVYGGTFTTTPTCGSPSNIIATNITSNSAIVSWTPSAVVPSTGYQYYSSTTNVAPLDSYNTSSDVFSSFSRFKNGLSPNTTYYVWIRSICGTNKSSWISGSFTTAPLQNCNGSFYGLYPENTFTPNCSGNPETIINNAYAGEFSNVNVISNREYTFSSSNNSDYITITDASGSALFANGTTPVIWQSNNYDGQIRYFIHTNSNCGNDNVNRTRFIRCSNTLDNNEFSRNEFVLYPNPVKNILNLSFDKEISSVSIFNLIGQEVIVKSLNSKEGIIDVSNLASGTYLVKVTSDEEIKTTKIIKE